MLDQIAADSKQPINRQIQLLEQLRDRLPNDDPHEDEKRTLYRRPPLILHIDHAPVLHTRSATGFPSMHQTPSPSLRRITFIGKISMGRRQTSRNPIATHLSDNLYPTKFRLRVTLQLLDTTYTERYLA